MGIVYEALARWVGGSVLRHGSLGAAVRDLSGSEPPAAALNPAPAAAPMPLGRCPSCAAQVGGRCAARDGHGQDGGGPAPAPRHGGADGGAGARPCGPAGRHGLRRASPHGVLCRGRWVWHPAVRCGHRVPCLPAGQRSAGGGCARHGHASRAAGTCQGMRMLEHSGRTRQACGALRPHTAGAAREPSTEFWLHGTEGTLHLDVDAGQLSLALKSGGACRPRNYPPASPAPLPLHSTSLQLHAIPMPRYADAQ